MSNIWFSRGVGLRLQESQFKAITEVLKNNPNKYKDVSHFIRCGIVKELRENGIKTDYGVSQ